MPACPCDHDRPRGERLASTFPLIVAEPMADERFRATALSRADAAAARIAGIDLRIK
jgi:hypothetical protein